MIDSYSLCTLKEYTSTGYGTVADPDQAFVGGSQIRSTKKVLTC